MPRTQRAIQRRNRRSVAARTSSNDLYRLSGSLGYSNGGNGNSNSSSSNGNDDTIEKTHTVRRASLSPPVPVSAKVPAKIEEDVSEESSDGWSDDENEMSGDLFFSPRRGNEKEDDDQSSSDSLYSASSSSQSNSGQSGDSSGLNGDEHDGSSEKEDEHPDYGYGETFESKFGQSEFHGEPQANEQPSDFGAGFQDDNMFSMGDANDFNSPAEYNSSGGGDQFFPETDMDDQGDFDSGFPDEEYVNNFPDSSSEEGDQNNGFSSIPMVISSSMSDDEHQQDDGLAEDEFADPTRNYDARYVGALSDVVESDPDLGSGSENENDFDNGAYDAGNAMYGSGSGLGYINADNSSRSQPDPLLKPFVGERPPTPPSPCKSASETSIKSSRSNRSFKSSRSAKSAISPRSPKSVKLPVVDPEENDDQFDCQTFLAPPSIDLGSNPDFRVPDSDERDLSLPYTEEESRYQDQTQQQQNMHDDQYDSYDGQEDHRSSHHGSLQKEGGSQFASVESDQYDGGDQYHEDEHYEGHGQYQYPPDSTYDYNHTEEPLAQEPSYHHPNFARDETTSADIDDSISTLEKGRQRDRKIIRLLAIGLCCALFSFAMVLGGAITAAILRRPDEAAEVMIPSNSAPQEAQPSPTVPVQLTLTLRPSLRPVTPQVTLTPAPTPSPTARPTQKPTVAPTRAPQSEAPTPSRQTEAPTMQPTQGSNNAATTGGFGAGFGNSDTFGSVTVTVP